MTVCPSLPTYHPFPSHPAVCAKVDGSQSFAEIREAIELRFDGQSHYLAAVSVRNLRGDKPGAGIAEEMVIACPVSPLMSLITLAN
jgi:hypothetical protein